MTNHHNNRWRDDFPILQRSSAKSDLVYFDSAATSLKPKQVISAVTNFYEEHTSSVSRSSHRNAEITNCAVSNARESIAALIGSAPDEIIFTANCTDGLNLLAQGLALTFDDEVIVSVGEHHSNILPWTEKSSVIFCPLDGVGRVDIDRLSSLINKRTKIISLAYVSNVTGVIQPIVEVAALAKKFGLTFVVDAAQAVGHVDIDVRKIDCDFLVFSGHKMLGPSGIGILYGQRERLSKLQRSRFGGGMAGKISVHQQEYQTAPIGFEAGTVNIEGAIGLGAAAEYFLSQDFNAMQNHMTELLSYFNRRTSEIPYLKLLFADTNERVPIFTFAVNGTFDAAMIANLLSDNYGIAARHGLMCCQTLFDYLGIKSGLRFSLHFYNTFDEIDTLADALNELF